MPNLSTDITAGNIIITGNLDVSGVVTATAGVVGNLTGNVAGLGTIVDLATKAPIASPTFTGTQTLPNTAITTLGFSGIMTASATAPTALSADQTDYASMGSTYKCILTSDATPRTMNSRSIASQQVQKVTNGNTATAILFAHEGAGTNKFSCPGGVAYSLAAGLSCEHFYDPAISRIRVTAG